MVGDKPSRSLLRCRLRIENRKRVTFGAALTLALMAATAQAGPSGKGGATVEKWAEGLAGPQGLAVDRSGQVLVVENGSGRVTRFARDGKKVGVVAEGLKAPSWALFLNGALYVAERKGNSVARIADKGAVTRLNGEVIDPLGLAGHPNRRGGLLALSHRQSVVRQFAPGAGGELVLQSEPFVSPVSGAQYGWRDVAVAADGTVYVTDELKNVVLRRSPGGALTEWATGLSSPSGLALTARGDVYVTEEGNGRLSRLTPEGKAEIVAEGLGSAREAIFLDSRTLLVSDRAGGAVWKVTLPASR